MKTPSTSPSDTARASLDATLIEATSKAKQIKAQTDELARLLGLLAILSQHESH